MGVGRSGLLPGPITPPNGVMLRMNIFRQISVISSRPPAGNANGWAAPLKLACFFPLLPYNDIVPFVTNRVNLLAEQ